MIFSVIYNGNTNSAHTHQCHMQGVSNHGNPGKVLEFHFSRPRKVMDNHSRLWKIQKKSWKLKGILLRNGVVAFFHPAFQYKETFMKGDQILVSSTSSCTVTGTSCVVLKGRKGLPSWHRYMSLSCHKACKRSLILKLWSWRNHEKVMEKILKFCGYTQHMVLQRPSCTVEKPLRCFSQISW